MFVTVGGAPGGLDHPGKAPSRPRDPDAILGEFDSWLRVSALPIWWTLGADHGGGGFHDKLSLNARPVGNGRRARVQARQVYVFARAGRFGWPGPWRAAVDHGLDALERFYRRPDGLYRRMVDNQGSPKDETALIYEQAFVLLALSEACHVTMDREPLLDEARNLLASLDGFRWASGGYRENDVWPFQANCHMHLFESCLAWLAVDGVDREPWFGLASEIADLALRRFIAGRHGVLHEVFDEQWAVASRAAGGCFDPGHQFEWAWLLDRWTALGGSVDRTIIEQLYENGRAGFDAARGVVINRMTADFEPLDTCARLWPQTEHLRAAAMMWRASGRDSYASHIVAVAEGLKPYLATPVPGLWRDILKPDGAFVDEPSPASSLYHLVCLLGADNHE